MAKLNKFNYTKGKHRVIVFAGFENGKFTGVMRVNEPSGSGIYAPCYRVEDDIIVDAINKGCIFNLNEEVQEIMKKNKDNKKFIVLDIDCSESDDVKITEANIIPNNLPEYSILLD